MAFWTKKNEQTSPTAGTTSAMPAALESKSAQAGAAEAPQPVAAAPQAASTSEGLAPRSAIRTAIGKGTKIQGKLSFDTPVRIDGIVKGEIFSSKQLLIGPSAQIDATIIAPSISVAGRVNGQLNASERVEVKAGAVVSGTLASPVLALEEGGLLDAQVSMGVGPVADEFLAQRIEKTKVSSNLERPTAAVPRASVALDAKIPLSSQVH